MAATVSESTTARGIAPALKHPERYFLALQTLPGLGPRREARLFETFASLTDLLGAGPTAWRSARLKTETITALRCMQRNGLQSPWLQAVERTEALCAERGWTLLSRDNPAYPALLLEIDQPPPLLFVWGDATVLNAPQVALVGSRKATAAGVRAATEVSSQCALAGLVVCSGMALGIDTASHKAALAQSQPTVAVLGSGLSKIYPARNAQLAEQIAQGGCVVTEFPPNTPPIAGNFPQRNRIISGLSRAVVVIEAAKRSGSLITARFALEQNREVFAVPGSINNAFSDGCNELIKRGARLLTSAEDLLRELGPILSAPAVTGGLDQFSQSEQELALELATVLNAVGYEPTGIDTVVAISGFDVAKASAILMQLQLYGRVEARGASFTRIR